MANVKITDLTPGTALSGTEVFESVQSAASVKLTADQIKTFTSIDPTLTITDAVTNTSSAAAKVQHTTSGTPANGIGVGIEFEVETSVSNNEVGAIVETVATDVTGASEDFDLVVKLMAGGSAAAEVARFTSDGDLQLTGDTVRLPTERTITNANDTGVKGDICWDSSYIYVCVATDTWKRVAIATWP